MSSPVGWLPLNGNLRDSSDIHPMTVPEVSSDSQLGSQLNRWAPILVDDDAKCSQALLALLALLAVAEFLS